MGMRVAAKTWELNWAVKSLLEMARKINAGTAK
jgi:hypothetical protein